MVDRLTDERLEHFQKLAGEFESPDMVLGQVCAMWRETLAEVWALKAELSAWQEGYEWWECCRCGDRFHGDESEAPFHKHSGHEPVCNNCGE